MIVVKRTFTHTFDRYTVEVPAGARTVPSDTNTYRWVDPSIFPSGSIERHDADHRGIRVYPDNQEEI
jgi:hypothetical protein